MRWGAVFRDVGIIFGLTLVGGFVVGILGAATALPQESMILMIAGSNILLSTIGFVISGVLTKVDRWKHLFTVAFVLWPVGLINIPFGITVAQWVFSILVILMTMALGGGISYLFSKPTSSSGSTEVPEGPSAEPEVAETSTEPSETSGEDEKLD